MNNSTVSEIFEPQDGYDIPLYGLDNGMFYFLHVPAIACILCGLTCAVTSVIISFRQSSYKDFFTKWSKSERFVVYVALCDGLFNVVHTMDHATIAVTRDYVRPRQLCEMYGFCIIWFIAAQMLLLNVVAINIFMLMYFDININFGTRDWRLLVYTFGVPFAAACVGAAAGQFGPFDGIACYFDSVRGHLAVWFTTVPSVLILMINTIIYIITWKRIREQTAAIKSVVNSSATANASRDTAQTMSMFVAVFILQWFPVGVHSVWDLITTADPVVLHLGVTLPNLGGCFNLAVCLMLRRRRAMQRKSVMKPKGQQDKDT
ncbi:hypothetical protein ACF0H5_023965 [Mactra antiquata]